MIIAPAQVAPFGPTTVDVEPFIGPNILHGWSWVETTGLARAHVELTDGKNGALIVPITLSAGQSTRDWLDGRGIYVVSSLFIHVLSGSVRGSLWATPDPHAQGAQPLDVLELAAQVLERLHR